MAHFRGVIQGNRGEASRLGSKRNGLKVEAASWQGKVVVWLTHNEVTGQDEVLVGLAPHHGAGTTKQLYAGPVGSFTPEA